MGEKPLSVSRSFNAFLLLSFQCALTIGCSKPAPRHPSVFIISIDTLRADHLPLYGYKGVKTPAIDSLGRDGVMFTDAYSHCPLTLPSHVSLLTGLVPARSGVHDNVGYVFDPGRHPTLAALLKANGYRTGAAVSAYVLRRSTGIAAGFDTYDDAIPFLDDAPTAALQRSGVETFQAAREWLDAADSRPMFFFLHLYEPHAPYAPPAQFAKVASPYDGEIAAADAVVGDFIAILRARKLYDDAVIILLSDHGEGLMEHGEQEHGILLYREDIHIPLIVKLPGNEKAHSVDRDDVQIVDIVPTLVDLTHVSPPPDLSGTSLLRSMTGKEKLPERTVLSETFYPRIHFGWSELRSAVRSGMHLIESPQSELFDDRRDPAEKHNVVDSQRRVVLELRKSIDADRSAFALAGRVDPEEEARLAALGYVTAGPAVTSGALPDPKDHLQDLSLLKGTSELMSAGRFKEAVPPLRALLDKNAGWSDVRDQLAVACQRSGDLDGAIALYREGIRVTPELAGEFALSLASIYLEGKQFDKAASHARLAMRSNAPGAHQVLGEIALAKHDLDAAMKEAGEAAKYPSQLMEAELLRARIETARGDRAAAAQDLRNVETEASRRRVASPAHTEFLLGDTLARGGETAEAEQHFVREIRRFPDNLEAYTSLALLQFLVDRQPSKAVATLDAMCSRNPSAASRKIAAENLTTWGDVTDAKRFER
ncbi:MAG TPA: sulfatase-like hydrolase/transferase [Thermoanaerobaculia bacterium]|nr:sulfatase-like hydrolase/transferase [Thermoanaerobaculia bacterium]